MVPPLQVMALVMVSVPAPVRVPPDRVREPLVVMEDAAAMERDPPEMIRVSSQVRLLMVCVPEARVMVGVPPTLMVTSSPEVGNVLPLQLFASIQVALSPPPSQDTAAAWVMFGMRKVRNKMRVEVRSVEGRLQEMDVGDAGWQARHVADDSGWSIEQWARR